MSQVDTPARVASAGHGVLLAAPIVFLVATGIGVAMRFVVVGFPSPIPFDHLLHAHSHALYFGWAALVVLGAAAAKNARSLRWAWAGLALLPVMTVAFLLQGYGPFSIAASAAVMLVWYGAMAAWWKDRGELFLQSFAYVYLASAGIWALAVLQATGRGEGLPARLAIHAFLSTFAWSLVLGTIALATKGGLVGSHTGRRVATWLAGGAWLLFPLGVVGGPEVPVLGWAARAAAVAVLLPTAWWVRALWRSRAGTSVRLAGAWLALATAGLAAVAVGGSPVLSTLGRPGTVVYLHALLLGYVTTLLAWFLARTRGVRVNGALAWHHLGVVVMLTGVVLPLAGAYPARGDWLAALGSAVVWGAGWAWAAAIWKKGWSSTAGQSVVAP